jgi:hypothetical protein
MASKTISQKRFAKGLNAVTGVLSQEQGSLTRMSNLLLTQRGSLQTCDGSEDIGTPDPNFPIILALGAYFNYSVGQFPYYCVLAQAATTTLGNTPLGPGIFGTGSTDNPAGIYLFGVVALDAAGNHTNILASLVTFTAALPFDSITMTWSALPGAVSYSVYYFPNGGSGQVVLLNNGTSTTFTSTPGALPTTPLVTVPVGNTTQDIELIIGTVIPTSSGILWEPTTPLYPGIPFEPAQLAPGDPNFTSFQAIPGYSPYGGILGVVEPIPQFLQFAALEIIILGNGLAPQSFNPSEPSVAPVNLANTFEADYPVWQASVEWIAGDQIQVPDGPTNVLFTASQGGTSGTTMPTFNFAMGAQTPDASVIWVSDGPIPPNVAPRGAAHGLVYAGSLWLANTSPQTTADNIDGPTVLKMSDSNNPNSWNPLNTAFIGRDDGTQITGLASFTIAALGISPTGSLAVFKEYQTYQIIGVFGSNDFEIQEAQTNMGCISARSIQFMPGFGIVRFTHLGFAVYDGVNDRLISEEIRSYIFGGIGDESDITPIDISFCYLSQGGQTNQPPMYVCAMPLQGANGKLTRMFCYDLVMKSWVIIDLPWPIQAMQQMRIGEGEPLLIAGRSDTGILERLQAGDALWDVSTDSMAGLTQAVAWSFRSPDIFGEGGSQKLFYNVLILRGYASVVQEMTISITPVIDGAVQPTSAFVNDYIVQDPKSGQFEIRLPVWKNGQFFHVNVAGTGRVVIDSIDMLVEPKSNAAQRIFG